MAKLFFELFVEMVLWFVRVLVMDLLWQGVVKLCAWLDTKIPGRLWPRLIIGGLLGLAAFFLFPIILGLLS
jgi:hypothetical protein